MIHYSYTLDVNGSPFEQSGTLDWHSEDTLAARSVVRRIAVANSGGHEVTMIRLDGIPIYLTQNDGPEYVGDSCR
jgi:hypothetical protein